MRNATGLALVWGALTFVDCDRVDVVSEATLAEATLYADIQQNIDVYDAAATTSIECPVFMDESSLVVQVSLTHSHPNAFACEITEPSGIGFDVAHRGVTIASFRDSHLTGLKVTANTPQTVVKEWPVSETSLSLDEAGVYVLLPRNPLSCEGAAPVTTTGRTLAFSSNTTAATIQIQLLVTAADGTVASTYAYGTTPSIVARFYNTAATDITCQQMHTGDFGAMHLYSATGYLGQGLVNEMGLQVISEISLPPGATDLALPPLALEYRDIKHPMPLDVDEYYVEYSGFSCGDTPVRPGVGWFEIVANK